MERGDGSEGRLNSGPCPGSLSSSLGRNALPAVRGDVTRVTSPCIAFMDKPLQKSGCTADQGDSNGYFVTHSQGRSGPGRGGRAHGHGCRDGSRCVDPDCRPGDAGWTRCGSRCRVPGRYGAAPQGRSESVPDSGCRRPGHPDADGPEGAGAHREQHQAVHRRCHHDVGRSIHSSLAPSRAASCASPAVGAVRTSTPYAASCSRTSGRAW